MPLVAFLPLAIALAICLVPVALLRSAPRERAQDYVVASQRTRPEVARSASIAYGLRLAAFGPLFAWGASGEIWPAVVASAFFGLGVCAIHLLRRPLLEFMDAALRGGRSMTIHEFIARAHGNDPRVRLFAASLTLFALLGLLAVEALALAAFLGPMLNGNVALACLLVLAALLAVVLSAVLSGHSGMMQSAQLQLGVLYLGLFAVTVLLLYLDLSTRAAMPARGAPAVLFLAVFGVVVLVYRHSKYVDTDPIRTAPPGLDPGRGWSAARALSRFVKILNIGLSVLLVLIVGVALMDADAPGWAAIVRDSAAALQWRTKMPGVGLLALALVPLFHPVTDVTNWLRLAATRKNSSDIDPRERDTALRSFLPMYALEVALLWLFVSMFGAAATIATGAQGGSDAFPSFVARLVAADDALSASVLALLLLCFFAAALSTMSALFSASLCTIRYDMVAQLWTGPPPGTGEAATEATLRRRTLLVGSTLSLAFVAAIGVAYASLPIDVASGTFLAAAFALCCAQLSLAPLVLGPIAARRNGGAGAVSARWAMVILAAGAASGAASAAVYLATGVEAWLWCASPACLASGFTLLAIARGSSQRSA